MSRRTIPLLATALLVAAATGWALLGRPGRAPELGGPGSDGSPASAQARSGRVGAEDAQVDPARSAADGSGRTAVEPSSAPADPSASIEVRVVDAQSGRALAGVEVVYADVRLDWSQVSEADRKFFLEHVHDQEAAMRRLGKTVVSDPDGIVRLPVDEPWRIVLADHDDLYGELEFDRREVEPAGGWRLELSPDRSLRVLVVDGAGRPAAGIGIGLRLDAPDGVGAAAGYLHLGSTRDPDGSLTIHHVRNRLRHLRPTGAAREPVRVVAHLPYLDEQGPSVDLWRAPDEPVSITLPPTGRIVASVTDSAGAPIRAAPRFRLTPTPDDAPPGGSRPAWNATAADDGQAVFDHLVLGERFEVRASLQAHEWSKTVAGPVGHGQEVPVAFRLGTDWVVLTGRASTTDGRPIRGRRLRLDFDTATRASAGQLTLRTDADGRFTALLDPSMAGEEITWLELELRSDGNHPTGMIATVGNPGRLTPGRRDLGDLVLGPAPIVVAGRLLGELGELPRRIQLRLEYLATGADGQPAWRSANGLSIRRLDERRFECRGAPAERRWRLLARSASHLPVEPMEFALGEQDLAVQLRSGGSARAVLLLDPDVDPDSLRLVLAPDRQPTGAPTDPFERHLGRRIGSRDGAATFGWQGLGAGPHVLEVHAAGTEQALCTVRDVVIEAGTAADDPRLESIDLRGRLRAISVRLVDPAGRAIRGGIVAVRGAAQDRIDRVFDARSGVASVPLGSRRLDLLVAAPGHRVELCDGVTDDLTVTLDPAPEARFVLSGTSARLPQGSSLEVRLGPADGSAADTRLRLPASADPTLREFVAGRVKGDLGGVGDLRLGLPRTGPYRVEYLLRHADGGPPRALTGVAPPQVDVGSGSEPRAVEVTLTDVSRDPDRGGGR